MSPWRNGSGADVYCAPPLPCRSLGARVGNLPVPLQPNAFDQRTQLGVNDRTGLCADGLALRLGRDGRSRLAPRLHSPGVIAAQATGVLAIDERLALLHRENETHVENEWRWP